MCVFLFVYVCVCVYLPEGDIVTAPPGANISINAYFNYHGAIKVPGCCVCHTGLLPVPSVASYRWRGQKLLFFSALLGTGL